MKKRLFSLFLTFVMVITLFSSAVIGPIGLAQQKSNAFVDALFSMDNPGMFMDMVETFYDLTDNARESFKDEYSGIINALDLMHDAEIDDEAPDNDTPLNCVYNLVLKFVDDETLTENDLANMRDYLVDNPDQNSFRDAFLARVDSEVEGDDDLTEDLIERGVSRLDTVFSYLKANQSLRIKIITKSTESTGGVYSDRGKLDVLMNAYFAIGGNDSQEAREAATSAFDSLIEYYNVLTNDDDKDEIDDYLSGLGLVYTEITDDDDDSPAPPPVIEDVDEDFSQAIEEDFETAGDVLDENASEADTEEEAQEVLNNTSIYIGAASDNLSENLEEAEEQIEKVASTVTNVGNTLDLIEDQEEAEEKVATIMESIAHMIENVQDSGADTSSLDKAAESLVSKVVEKAGTTTVASTKDGTKAAADLSDLDMTEQIQKVKSAADNMGTKLEENQIQTIKQKIETKVTINVETEGEVNEVDVTVPDLDEAFETVDKVKISSSIASFELEKDTFDTQSDDEHEDKINLNAKKPTEEELDEIKSNLAPGQSIPEGAEVIQLSASIQKVSRSTGEGVSTTPVTTFKQRIKLSVPYTLKEGENPKEVSVFLVQDDGTVKKVGGVYNPTTKQAEFYRKTFSNYYVAASRVTFDDTANLETMYKDSIEILAGKGLIAGKTLSLYDPDALVTRAEFTVLIARMLDLEADPAELPFNDVDNDNAWYRNHLAGAYNAGIINGTSATTFHPQNKITRQEAAAIAVNAARFLGYKDADGSKLATRYQDHEQIAPWAVRSVATVHRDKLAEGMYDGSFMPKELVTRDETAVLIYNMLFEY